MKRRRHTKALGDDADITTKLDSRVLIPMLFLRCSVSSLAEVREVQGTPINQGHEMTPNSATSDIHVANHCRKRE